MEIKRRIELFKKRNGVDFKDPMELCPAFERCQCNRCPLNPDPNQKIDSSDFQKKCLCAKSIRKEIGSYFKLKNEGLTGKELAGARLWAKMSEKERQEKILKIKEKSPVARCLEKNLIVTPRKKSLLSNPQANQEKSAIFTQEKEVSE